MNQLPPGFYAVPRWQRNVHVVTEAAALIALPTLFAAASAASGKHKAFLRRLAWGTLVVDGVLLLSWLRRR